MEGKRCGDMLNGANVCAASSNIQGKPFTQRTDLDNAISFSRLLSVRFNVYGLQLVAIVFDE